MAKRGHDGPTLAERTFERLLEAAPDAVVGEDGRAELLGTPVERLVAARFRAAHAGYRARYLSDPRTRLMGEGRELFGLRRHGGEFPAEISLAGVETESGWGRGSRSTSPLARMGTADRS